MVLTVDDHISPILENAAKIYNHQIVTPNSKPGIMIMALATNAKNSTVFAFVQYFFWVINLKANTHSVFLVYFTLKV